MATKGYGIAFPTLDDSAERGFLVRTRTVGGTVRSNLFLLITTRKGTRWRRPSYGCTQIHRLFDPNDEVTIQEIEQDLRLAVDEWLPGVKISALNYRQEGRLLVLQVYFEYREGVLSRREVLEIPLGGEK